MKKGKEESVEFIVYELEKLLNHIKTYSKGSFPAYYLQLHTILKIQDIVEMRLSDVYWCDGGNVKVKKEFTYKGVRVRLGEEDRKELAWYALQRIPVINTHEGVLDDYLCVNKQGKRLQKQVYRKMLERSSGELKLSRVYNSGYLRSLYGYLKIAYGHETIEAVAIEYEVEKYYLINRTFRDLPIRYAENVLNTIACVD